MHISPISHFFNYSFLIICSSSTSHHNQMTNSEFESSIFFHLQSHPTTFTIKRPLSSRRHTRWSTTACHHTKSADPKFPVHFNVSRPPRHHRARPRLSRLAHPVIAYCKLLHQIYRSRVPLPTRCLATTVPLLCDTSSITPSSRYRGSYSAVAKTHATTGRMPYHRHPPKSDH